MFLNKFKKKIINKKYLLIKMAKNILKINKVKNKKFLSMKMVNNSFLMQKEKKK